jgi:long-chain acyl-CoA synthetase
METLLDLLETSVDRFTDRTALRLDAGGGEEGEGRSEGGRVGGRDSTDGELAWSYRELDRRSRIAAGRLRALGVEAGDRVLTWSPSTPALPATYFGAVRAGVIFVPLDLRMSPDAIRRIAEVAGARRLIVGTGRDAPDPVAAGLVELPTTTVEALVAEPDESFPGDWAAQVAAWPRPAPDDVVTLIFTSGTTGTPKGVMLAHDNLLAAIRSYDAIIPHLEHRVVSLLPLSHLFELLVGLLYLVSVGADIRYVRSRNPRVIFGALVRQRVTSMIVVPQILDLFWAAIERELDRSGRRRAFERLRAVARRLPFAARRWLFRSVHARLGGGLRLFVSSGAFLPPALQLAWEDLGVVVMQGYGATETASGTCTTLQDHGLGTVGRAASSVEVRLGDDGEVLFRGPTLFKGYWNDPAATAAAFDADGWYRTGDVGRFDPEGRLILMGRKKDMIVLPNGLNVYPEDVENALRIAGIRDAVVVEARPRRLEAVVLAPGRGVIPQGAPNDASPAGAAPASPSGEGSAPATPSGEGSAPAAGVELSDAARTEIGRMIKAANATLGQHQRVDGWRLWPEADFPRTHTLKIRRNLVQAWAESEASTDGRR